MPSLSDDDLHELRALCMTIRSFFEVTGISTASTPDWDHAFVRIRSDDDLASSFLVELRRLVFQVEGLAEASREELGGVAEADVLEADLLEVHESAPEPEPEPDIPVDEEPPPERPSPIGPLAPMYSDHEATVVTKVKEVLEEARRGAPAPLAETARAEVAGPRKLPSTTRKFLDDVKTETVPAPTAEELARDEDPPDNPPKGKSP